MFAVLYKFDVLAGKEDPFLEAWIELTKLIRDYEGGLGSRIHKTAQGEYYAYAQWPDRKTWQGSGDNLPPEAEKWRKQMRNCCSEITTELSFGVVFDLLEK